MSVTELYDNLSKTEADPERLEELCLTLSELEDREVLETILSLIVQHAERHPIKGNILLNKPPFKGEAKGKSIDFKLKNLPVELKRILVAYLEMK